MPKAEKASSLDRKNAFWTGDGGVKLHCRRKCLGMCNAVAKVFPEATPKKHMSEVSRILEAIHAQENKEAARKKVRNIV